MTTGNLVPIERHNRLTAGPAVWTDTRVPIEVFGIACAVYGAGSEDDDKRIYRTIQAVLWKLATQSPAQEESPAAPVQPVGELPQHHVPIALLGAPHHFTKAAWAYAEEYARAAIDATLAARGEKPLVQGSGS